LAACGIETFQGINRSHRQAFHSSNVKIQLSACQFQVWTLVVILAKLSSAFVIHISETIQCRIKHCWFRRGFHYLRQWGMPFKPWPAPSLSLGRKRYLPQFRAQPLV
jgi:hypothetical protein